VKRTKDVKDAAHLGRLQPPPALKGSKDEDGLCFLLFLATIKDKPVIIKAPNEAQRDYLHLVL
jgi:hypothetical protein